ncbi:MAG: flagellar biosynthesis protein FliQ [Lachnospiraceae bacterium]|nr:flagellar biosynthesis protein FliQ [Lachnospiraceae bacterium]
MITEGQILDIARDAIYTIVMAAAPVLLVSLVVGLIISIFQTVTSIQEQTLTFVPKILAVFATILIGGGWMLILMSTFTVNLWQDFSKYVR